jgi:hypothetical protein
MPIGRLAQPAQIAPPLDGNATTVIKVAASTDKPRGQPHYHCRSRRIRFSSKPLHPTDAKPHGRELAAGNLAPTNTVRQAHRYFDDDVVGIKSSASMSVFGPSSPIAWPSAICYRIAQRGATTNHDPEVNQGENYDNPQ